MSVLGQQGSRTGFPYAKGLLGTFSMAMQQKGLKAPWNLVWIRHRLEQAPFLVSTMLKINRDHEESPDDLSAGENASE